MLSNEFKKGKVYRFVPTKTQGFKESVRDYRYSEESIWELQAQRTFMVTQDCTTVVINGYIIKRNWCEEVK